MPAAKPHAKPDPKLALVEMFAAINEGRHSERWRTVCDGCREWVDGIWKITIDKKRLCRKCSGE